MSSVSVVSALSVHPQLAPMASLVRASAMDATLARRADYASRHRLASGPAVGPGHVPEGLTREVSDTPFGNPFDILERGVEREEERALLGALLAFGLKEEPYDGDSLRAMGSHLVWLAAHTPCSAFPFIDAVLSEVQASAIWGGAALILTQPEAAPSDFGMTEALVSASVLQASSSKEAYRLRLEAAEIESDPSVYALLTAGIDELGSVLRGELQPAPRGPIVTTVLAFTGLLFIAHAFRLIARAVFAYRRPAVLRLGPQGLELSHRVEMMGRVLNDHATVVPLFSLARITRETRFARAGLYVGLLALMLGTYFGTDLFVSGVRVPSGSGPLLGLAGLFIVAGLGVDFVLSSAGDALRGKSRLVIVPTRGRTLCVGALDPAAADALLDDLVEYTRRAGLVEPTDVSAKAPPTLADSDKQRPSRAPMLNETSVKAQPTEPAAADETSLN
ncbi:MAG TPA: hypothetical protein VFQ61_24420 [Polyangiaceae bacterium]|nr:hypothetical protein [Polyangiaceae bacterium]